MPAATPISRSFALITGCSEPNGFGSNIALELTRKGYRVFASARRAKAMSFLEGVCELVELDVTDPKSREAAVKHISEVTGGKLSVLVNNAGVVGDAPALDTDLDRYRAMFEVNVVAPLAMVQAFAPLLVAAANDVGGRRSVVVNVGSFTMHGAPWNGAYVSTKAALGAFSDCMRVELKGLGISVINCELGAFSSQMYKNLKGVPIQSPTPSPYYPNYAAIDAAIRRDVAKNIPMTCQALATKLVRNIERTHPPGKIWIGTFATIMALWAAMFEMLRLVWVKDLIWEKTMYTGMVLRPGKKAD